MSWKTHRHRGGVSVRYLILRNACQVFYRYKSAPYNMADQFFARAKQLLAKPSKKLLSQQANELVFVLSFSSLFF
ncbi:hypothetical protein BZG73_08200 [Salinivibrio siamensis]|uniref:Transposase n=1 Tax=Salinivibrio siamensis TaxID=414286 RepID=A0ABX3K9I3_9GAMM|nr:hypothetical protein BZG73_08200 [Salinivibrio siamensis]